MLVSQFPENVVLDNSRVFVEWWFDSRSYSWTAAGTILSSQGFSILASSALRDCRLDYEDKVKLYNANNKTLLRVKRFSNDSLADAFEWFKEKERSRIKDDLINQIKFNPTNPTDHLATFITACTGEISGPSYEASYYAMAHWVWQVKRKLNGLPVKDHLMPIFHGAQGCGKSTAINLLIDSLSSFTQNLKVYSLVDDRNNYLFAENYIVFCDEMQGGARTDIDGLKHIITANEVTGRRMRTNVYDKIPQNCSFIGATNKDLQELIIDETGVRRFYVVECLAMMDHKALNSIPYQEIWSSIDENNSAGYSHNAIQHIKAAQEESRVKCNVELFLEENCYIPASTDKTSNISCQSIYDEYKDWCSANGFAKPMTSTWFGRRAAEYGVVSTLVTSNNATKRFYVVRDPLKNNHSPLCSVINMLGDN